MMTWKELLEQGNHAFRANAFYAAKNHYETAIHIIEHEWALDHSTELFMGWVAAMHNMVELFEAKKLERHALEYLQHTYMTSQKLSNENNLSSELQAFALKMFAMTRTKLLLFAKSHQLDEQIMQDVDFDGVPTVTQQVCH